MPRYSAQFGHAKGKKRLPSEYQSVASLTRKEKVFAEGTVIIRTQKMFVMAPKGD